MPPRVVSLGCKLLVYASQVSISRCIPPIYASLCVPGWVSLGYTSGCITGCTLGYTTGVPQVYTRVYLRVYLFSSRFTVGLVYACSRHPFHCGASLCLLPSPVSLLDLYLPVYIPVSLLGYIPAVLVQHCSLCRVSWPFMPVSLLGLFPFHCWTSLPRLHHPFHCWSAVPYRAACSS